MLRFQAALGFWRGEDPLEKLRRREAPNKWDAESRDEDENTTEDEKDES